MYFYPLLKLGFEKNLDFESLNPKSKIQNLKFSDPVYKIIPLPSEH
jgi:hypothetical protein